MMMMTMTAAAVTTMIMSTITTMITMMIAAVAMTTIMSIITIMMKTKNTNITIIMTTMTIAAVAMMMSIITIMMKTKNMNITIIMTTTMTAAAAMTMITNIIITIMQTKYSPAGVVPVTKDQLEDILKRLAETKEFGDVLRAKGMLPTENPGEWLYFDLVPEQYEIRDGKPDYTGKVCVIGASLKEEELNKVFGRG